jgi:nitrogen PTS system EIIA component
MKILDYLHEETILTDLQSTDKKGVIDELAFPVAQMTGKDQGKIAGVLIERERYGSTGIGGGIAIPHGKLAGLERLVIGFGLSRQGVNFDTLDGKPAHIFFMLLSPDDSTGLHLMLLARISRLLKDQQFKKQLLIIRDAQAVIRIISEADTDL